VRWAPGDAVVRREVWQGRPWLGNTLRVVEDDGDLLVLYQPEGSPFGFGAGDDWPTTTGLHPYAGKTAWVGEGPLGLHRAGDPYAVWAYWAGPERTFLGWYVNIQMPYRRTAIGIDSLDLELDLLVSPTYEVTLKDEAHVDQSGALGRYSMGTAARIHEVGAEVRAAIEAGGGWWDERWSEWVPPPDLRQPPSLPEGWADVPAEVVTDLGLLEPPSTV
jgi:hypothetical protein